MGWWLAGAALMLVLSSGVAWGVPDTAQLARAALLVTGVLLAYITSVLVTRRMASVEVGPLHPLISVTTTLFAFGVLSAVLLFARTYYSRSFLLTAAIVAALWLVGGRWLKHRLFRPALAVEPGAVRAEALDSRAVDWRMLGGPVLPPQPVDALVANLEADDPEWQRFHAQCEVGGLPVHHGPAVSERLTGRVSLARLSAGYLSDLRPHPVYGVFKRCLDLGLVIGSAPLVLPLVGIIALIIRADSPGPAFFTQARVGERGRVFRMVKFRSMHCDDQPTEARFAGEVDDRVTRLGALLRRTRLDELPQFWNVLRGEMSVIGPRPEQVDFVSEFEDSIPFYGYRHLVKPGITGWAQVNQGYAASEDDTREKLEYDLYYAKHCSIWLDLIIVFRTFRIILTGDGAR